MKLEGKIAVVTGGAKGIGAAVARLFAAEGARVVIADIDSKAAEETVRTITEAGGECFFQETDVSNTQQVDTLFQQTVERYGPPHILVNNAGVVHGPTVECHFLEMTKEKWDQLLSVNLGGFFYCSLQAARLMAQQEAGCIINMSSCGATRAHRLRVGYDAAKGGMEAATRTMALDLAPWGIRVNALAPGAIAVEQRSPVGAEKAAGPTDLIPLGRLGTPDEVAQAALFLASDGAAYVTGHTLFVDGGLTAQLRPPALEPPPR
jgi:3-oxoacyl-[acyl-carrier protein] reductase